MKIARYYTFELEFLKPAKLPKWKGNLIRGVFGANLKKLYCINDLRDCHKCNLLFRCPYGYLFRAKTKGIVLRRLEHYTKPYVVKPPLDSKTSYKPGEVIRFSLVLFGDAVEFEDQVFNAVNTMCKFGLGIRDFKAELRLKRAFIENPFKNEKEFLFEEGEIYNPKLFIRRSDLKIKVGRVFKIRFLTPFRLLRDQALISEPSFRDLLSFMLRKYSSITYQYLKREVEFDVEKLLKFAENSIATISSNLNKRTFVYKGREEHFVHGEIIYSGKLKADIREVLGFCELSHIGKRTTYGHGWYVVE